MLEIRDVHAGYATGMVLEGVTLSVAEREVHTLLGRNGMGKTTLLRAICGLRPPTVSEGSVIFQGREITRLPSYEVARQGIGFVPQGRRIFGSLTVEENLLVVARPTREGWTLRRLYELFPQLAERRRQPGSILSGGEQQMLAIGRALLTNPRLLVMDEPSEGLAPALHQVILEHLRLLKDAGQAVLLAEQNVDLGLAAADRVAVLGEAGIIAWAGSPEQLLHDPPLLRELVGLPAPASR